MNGYNGVIFRLGYKKIDQNKPLSNLPPQNIEAEESILSAMLIGGDASHDVIEDVLELLSPQDFYKHSHGIVFKSIIDLFHEGNPIDIVTVKNALEKDNSFEKIGGINFLSRLTETIPIVVNTKHYAKIVKDKAILRNIIKTSSLIINSCFEYGRSAEEAVNYAEKAILEISDSENKEAVTPIGEVVDSSVALLEKRAGSKSPFTGIQTGFLKLDSLTAGLQDSDLIIIAARPAMGKTAFALNIARNSAKISKKAVAIFSLEMSKEQLVMRMLCSEARVNASLVRTGQYSTGEDWERITNAAGKLTSYPIYIDDSPNISVGSIRAKSKRFKKDENLDLIIIDYLQLMKGNSRFDRRDLEISEISRSLKMLAKELNVPVVALSQLNRKLEDRSDKRPQLSDLRESGALEQDADVVIFIYRDEIYNNDINNPNKGIAEIIVSKQRNGPIGKTQLTFIDSYTRFENIAIDRY